MTLVILLLEFAVLEDLHELSFDDLKLLDCDSFKGEGLLVMLASDRADHEAFGLLELSELCGIYTFRERDGLVVENHDLMAVLVDEGSLCAEMEGLVFVYEVVLSDFEDVDFQFAAHAVDDPAHDLDAHLGFISAVLLFLENPNLEILDPGAENVNKVENFNLIFWDRVQPEGRLVGEDELERLRFLVDDPLTFVDFFGDGFVVGKEIDEVGNTERARGKEVGLHGFKLVEESLL